MALVQLPVCWEKSNIPKAISQKAKLDEKQKHYFLACHSPMKHIQDVLGRNLTEEELYEKIKGSAQRDIQAVICGAPGTGKSHLIHWLKLRYDLAISMGEVERVVPVLIERRSGSLKDALEQVIEQLGARFEKYLDPVRKAIEKLSEATARQMLAYQLSLELGPGWADRGREPLPKLLKHLGQACAAKGFGKWLCRDDGVIDHTIRILTEASEIQERESRPQFSAADLVVPDRFSRPEENSIQVQDLVIELTDDPELRSQAAEIFNDALRHAVANMVGLSGGNLRKIFDVIRGDLETHGKELALFIEDVSVMAELDTEVVNALEPQDRRDLCPLTAVLGMTQTGYGNLRDNQKQRITVLARVDGDSTKQWMTDRKELAYFTARYLNATRLTEEQVVEIERHRRTHAGSDVHISKCTECSFKPECHPRFGKVRIEDVDIGLYPLSNYAPHRILERLDQEEGTDIPANQRGLLNHVLSPLLSDTDAFDDHSFPRDGTLPISIVEPLYWPELLQKYCGSWSASNKRRLLYLAQLWIEEATDADEAAGRLLAFAEPFGLPEFSKEAQVSPGDTEDDDESEEPVKPERKKKSDKSANRPLERMRKYITDWSNGEDLRSDADFRRIVAGFLRLSIAWDSEREPPTSEWRRLIAQGYEFVYIDGQKSQPATARFFIKQFPRNEETKDLLEALVRFSYEGGDSWDFPGGELHKRVAAQWVRRHSAAVITSLQPPLATDLPVASAIHFLCLAAIVRRREKLPQAPAKAIAEILADCWEARPTALSLRWQQLLEDMESRHEQVRKFVLEEAAVTQGRRGGLNFISPTVVLRRVSDFLEKPEIALVTNDYFEGFWKTRYSGLTGGFQPYGDLGAVIDAERQEIKEVSDQLRSTLQSAGYSIDDAKEALVAFCRDLDELVLTRTNTRQFFPNSQFDDFYRQGLFSERRQQWGAALVNAVGVAESKNLYDLLLFDPTPLTEAANAINIANEYAKWLDREIGAQEEAVTKEGDPEELEKALLDALGKVSELVEEEKELNSVAD